MSIFEMFKSKEEPKKHVETYQEALLRVADEINQQISAERLTDPKEIFTRKHQLAIEIAKKIKDNDYRPWKITSTDIMKSMGEDISAEPEKNTVKVLHEIARANAKIHDQNGVGIGTDIYDRF
jgi:hypothetical protein